MSEFNQERENKGGFWLGLAIGGLVGAVASYFAVTDDKQRRKLLKKGRQLLEGLEELGGDVVEKGGQITEQVTDKIEDVSEVVKEKTPSVQKAAKKAVKQVKGLAEDAVQEVQGVAEDAAETAREIKKSALKRFFFKKGKPLVKKKK